MRLNRLDLIRYGKFTDRSVALPRRPHDFHLILGANEAGKSTLRSAILDLLFGLPVRTPLDFLHAKAELRVGAVIEHGGEVLDFIRVKANKNTLRTPDETPLPDTALDHFLGGAGRAFFDKMFGLDHPRLVEGGNSILNAQDDVGQVLFQSAAGLVSLGKVRDALEQEADGLWAPTRSSKRTYYAARDDLDQASAALKAATVRTREWAEAHERVQALVATTDEHRTLLVAQQARRSQLERVRRVSPVMRALHEAESLMDELGDVVDLGAEAARTLADAERAQALARHGLGLRHTEVARLEKEIQKIDIEDALLAASSQIEALEAFRHQYRTHEQAITRSQGQLDQLWKEVLQAGNALRLPATEEKTFAGTAADVLVLQTALPGLPVRKQVERLLREHGGVSQAVEAAHIALSGRQAEAEAVEAKLRAQPVPDVDVDLRAALEASKALGDSGAAMQKATRLRDEARAALEPALAGLGRWARTPEELVGQDWPSAQTVASWLSERRSLLSDVKAAAQRHDELDAAAQKAALRLQQYRERYHPTTLETLGKARHLRDDAWQAIKRGEQEVGDAAFTYESLVRQADVLADTRHDKAHEVAQMQGLQHQQEEVNLELELARVRLASCRSALDDCEARWRSTCERLGLAGLPLDQAPDWLVSKDRVLEANRALIQSEQDVARLRASHQTVCDRLVHALKLPQDTTKGAPAAALDTLRTRAEASLHDADTARVRQETWRAQAAEARPALEAAQQALQRALTRQADWHTAWSRALKSLGLEATTSLGAVEGALELISVMADKLEQMRRLRSERLDVMQDEVKRFNTQAAKLAVAVGLDNAVDAASLSFGRAQQVSQTLGERLILARRAQERAFSLKQALETERSAIREAEQALQVALAKVRPLMDRAGVDTLEALADAVGRSDQYRAWRERVDQAQARLLHEGDGLTRAQLQEELDAVDVETLLTEWAGVQAEIEHATKTQSELAVALADAQRKLDAMAGTDNAARAEARRQDALARMSVAADRYIKVYTAARLLRWSIDRYREEKQGPMLARASAIFGQLTLNSFERLRVDFDRHPMVLEGQRPDGHRVGISGLSDGTRDQLYLALRLAALELHLAQAPSLPFIADDLFINYDDARTEAGLRALADLSRQTQVIFLSHHDALLESARRVFGDDLNVVTL